MIKEDRKSKEFLARVSECFGIIRSASRIYGINREEQDDLYQEIMLQLWKSYDTFTGAAKFSTWVYRVALNTALTFYGKIKIRAKGSNKYNQLISNMTYFVLSYRETK